jgi:hypothetical protein
MYNQLYFMEGAPQKCFDVGGLFCYPALRS